MTLEILCLCFPIIININLRYMWWNLNIYFWERTCVAAFFLNCETTLVQNHENLLIFQLVLLVKLWTTNRLCEFLEGVEMKFSSHDCSSINMTFFLITFLYFPEFSLLYLQIFILYKTTSNCIRLINTAY